MPQTGLAGASMPPVFFLLLFNFLLRGRDALSCVLKKRRAFIRPEDVQ